jgi:hypothetical protein
VCVVPFLSNGSKYQVSTNRGWLRRQGIFLYHDGNRLITASWSSQSNFHLKDLHPLFQMDLPNFAGLNYDV